MSTALTATETVAVDVVPVITAGINALGTVIKLTDDELTVLNSPANVAARQAAWEQAQRDEDALAVKKAESGDATELEERSS